MKCMVLEKFGAPLVQTEREIPVAGEGEVILKVGACGVCQTDLKVWKGNHPAVKQLPVVLGHEVAGEIIEAGPCVDKTHLGKHAIIFLYNTCGECKFCRDKRESLCVNVKGQVGMTMDGGYAEYVKVPVNLIYHINDNVPFEQAAILTDAVVTPYHALVSKARVQPGDIVALFGTGGLGLQAVQIAKVLGAKVIAVDINDQALKLAEDMGADWIFKSGDALSEQINDISGGRGVDAVVDFTGHPEMEALAMDVLGTGGKFVAVAYNPARSFPVNSFNIVTKELEIYGARWCGSNDFKECIELVSSSKVVPHVGEVYPLAKANDVLMKLERGEIISRAVLIP